MLRTACSMLAGTLAISGYNIADTWFVSSLGTDQLAAMGFTFPVIMLIGCVYRGLCVGVMTPTAHSLGGRPPPRSGPLVTSWAHADDARFPGDRHGGRSYDRTDLPPLRRRLERHDLCRSIYADLVFRQLHRHARHGRQRFADRGRRLFHGQHAHAVRTRSECTARPAVYFRLVRFPGHGNRRRGAGNSDFAGGVRHCRTSSAVFPSPAHRFAAHSRATRSGKPGRP